MSGKPEIKPPAKRARKPVKAAPKPSGTPAPAGTAAPNGEYKPDLAFLPEWSKRLGKTVEELEKLLRDRVAALQAKHKDYSEDKLWSTARRRTYADFKAEFRSTATPWIGRVLWQTSPYDFGNKAYSEAKALYKAQPDKARRDGIIREVKDVRGKVVDVIPVDNREKFEKSGKDNPNFGEDLPEHNFIANIGGMAMPLSAFEKSDFTQIRPFFMTVSRDLANPEKELYLRAPCDEAGRPLEVIFKFKATSKTDKKNLENWDLNATTVTKFVIQTGEDGNPLSYMGDLEEKVVDETTKKEEIVVRHVMHNDDILNVFAAFHCTLGEMEEYHTSFAEMNKDGTKESSRRILVTEGDVVEVVFADTEDANNRIVIDDASLGFGDAEEGADGEQKKVADSITCWVEQGVDDLAFGKYSRIVTLGTTSRTLKKDPAGKYTDEWNTVSIAVNRIIVLEWVEPEDVEDEAPGDTEAEESDGEVEEAPAEEGEVPNVTPPTPPPAAEKPAEKPAPEKPAKPAKPAEIPAESEDDEDDSDEETETPEGKPKKEW